MANNKLYGSHYIERQRSSGYRSTTYAMAEIVDNSVDAGATKIKIVLSEKEIYNGNRSRPTLDRIFFLDNGSGITEKRLNNCLTFSEGDGRNDKRIGAFGVGLPNSSIATCRRVDVYSRKKGKPWKYVFLDVDDQLTRKEPGYDFAIDKKPNYPELGNIPDDISTIIIWSNLDKIDVSRAETLVNRSEKLLGRIYRYKLIENLSIKFEAFRQDKSEPILSEKNILPYDPLYVTDKENYMTSLIWKFSEEEENSGKDPEFGHMPEFNSMHYYKEFIKGCKRNQNKPLFQKYDDYWDVPYEKTLNGKTYKWKIRASFAYSGITNPGVRSGGGTTLGKEFGKKMSGDTHFKSGNIYFIRSNREIDFGSFGLYTVTDEKNRFWTIEIHFDSDLDELMGLSNNKQSTQFKYIASSEIDNINENDDIPLGLQREILYEQMSSSIKHAIKGMRLHLSVYSKQFKQKLDAQKRIDGGENTPITPVEPAVIQVFPKNEPWSEEAITEVTKYLKSRYLNVEENLIRNQVEKHSKGLTRTIVLYAPSQTGLLFEITEKIGKLVTLINTNHIYYTNIIDPLKSDPNLKIFAISIEMLISSFAVEMDKLIFDNEEKYKSVLDIFLLQLSSRLNEFISDSRIKINPEEFSSEILETMDLEVG